MSKMTMKTIAIIALVMFVSPALSSSPPAGWRFPDEFDIWGGWEIARQKGSVYYYFSADFNGDNRKDEAWILIAKDNSAWGLFVFLTVDGANKRIIELVRVMNVPPQRMGIKPAPPGHYISACAKGDGPPCRKGEKKYLELKHMGINFFIFESAIAIWYWNELSTGFERMWVSD